MLALSVFIDTVPSVSSTPMLILTCMILVASEKHIIPLKVQ